MRSEDTLGCIAWFRNPAETAMVNNPLNSRHISTHCRCLMKNLGKWNSAGSALEKKMPPSTITSPPVVVSRVASTMLLVVVLKQTQSGSQSVNQGAKPYCPNCFNFGLILQGSFEECIWLLAGSSAKSAGSVSEEDCLHSRCVSLSGQPVG